MSAPRDLINGPLIAEFLAGRTIEAAARAAGVSSKTVSRRLRDPEFVFELRQAREELVSLTVVRLAGACEEAAQTLRELLSAPQDSVRLRAAQLILDSGARFAEPQDLIERIDRLERILA